MSFSQPITGLQAAAAQLDVTGNNIANASTVGFKSGSVAFKDVIAGSKIGLGVAVAGVEDNFAAGSIQLTNRPLDMAITNGTGFFQIGSPTGSNVAYSRNGQFSVDKNGYVVNPDGMRLMGYGLNSTGAIAGGSPAALQFPTASMTPNATSAITAQFNLDARNPIVAPAKTFNPTDSSTYTYANSVNVYDSLGNAHEMTLYFAKTDTATSAWSVYGTLDGQVATSTPAAASITFDANGALNPAGAKITFGGNYNNGSNAPNFSVDLSGSTQYGSTSAVQKLTQDGYTSGNLTSYEVGKDGVITGKYSNDQTKTLGQVALSSFANPNGLTPNGSNEFLATQESGAPLTGAPGEGTTLGSITAGALEQSNVDLTSELVTLITAQRFYQANGQTLKTQNDVTQTLLNMR